MVLNMFINKHLQEERFITQLAVRKPRVTLNDSEKLAFDRENSLENRES